SRQKLADQVHRASRRRSSHSAADPEMAEGRSHGGRQMVGAEDRYASGLGDHAPYTKGNFQFERTVAGWRTRYPLLDLRLKRSRGLRPATLVCASGRRAYELASYDTSTKTGCVRNPARIKAPPPY